VLGLSFGLHGFLIIGTLGGSGNSTWKLRLNGQGVFSNSMICARTDLRFSVIVAWLGSVSGNSIRQNSGLRICRTNLLESSSTHQQRDFAIIGCITRPQLMKATEPGALYILSEPTAIVFSLDEAGVSLPISSCSCSYKTLTLVRFDGSVMSDDSNDTIRTEGWT
jgi:hypothetical protein